MSELDQLPENVETSNTPRSITTIYDVRNLVLAAVAGALVGHAAMGDYGHIGWMSGSATALLAMGLWNNR